MLSASPWQPPKQVKNASVAATSTIQSARVHQDFYVFEPEVNGLIRFSEHVRLTGGAGYRFTGNGWYNNYYYYGYPGNTSPSGWTASVGVQFGSGS